MCCHGKQRETYNTSGRSRQAAEGAGAANRAAAVGGVALDAKARWKLAEAAVSWRYSPIGMPARADPSTWTDYTTALATVQAGRADGMSYILTGDDPFGAIDLDHCRCTVTNSHRRMGAELSAGRR